MSNNREKLIEEVALAIRMHGEAEDEIDEAAGGCFGINRTDLRCLGILDRRGRITAGELANESGLTTGAITALLDRMERAGCIRRVRDESDRRKVLVELTDEARRRSWEIYGPIAESGRPMLERYTDEELILIRDFIRAGRKLLLEHAARARAMTKETSSIG